jgi:hypothetical protein
VRESPTPAVVSSVRKSGAARRSNAAAGALPAEGGAQTGASRDGYDPPVRMFGAGTNSNLPVPRASRVRNRSMPEEKLGRLLPSAMTVFRDQLRPSFDRFCFSNKLELKIWRCDWLRTYLKRPTSRRLVRQDRGRSKIAAHRIRIILGWTIN